MFNLASRLTFNEACNTIFGDPCDLKSNLICLDQRCVCDNGFKWNNDKHICSIQN